MDTPLLAGQRRALIRAEIARSGAVRVADLTDSLGVSEMTVRRDITALADEGVLSRVHGGAISPVGSAIEPTFAAKAGRASEQKAAIGAAVAALVEPGTSLGITAGTTTVRVAEAIARLPHSATLSVLTNSLPAAEVLLAESDHPSVILTGGEPTPSAGLVGPLAVAACRDFHLDVLVLGVSGMSLDAGLTSPNVVESETLRAFIDAASRVIVAADSSKWDEVALRTIARWDAVDVVVTDDALPPAAAAELRELVELHLIPTAAGAVPAPTGSTPDPTTDTISDSIPEPTPEGRR